MRMSRTKALGQMEGASRGLLLLQQFFGIFAVICFVVNACAEVVGDPPACTLLLMLMLGYHQACSVQRHSPRATMTAPSEMPGRSVTPAEPGGTQDTFVAGQHPGRPAVQRRRGRTPCRDDPPSASSALQAGIQNAQLSSAAVGVTNVVGTIIAGSIIEKAGRKQLLTISYSGMAVAMLALAAGSSVPALASSAGEHCLRMTPWAKLRQSADGGTNRCLCLPSHTQAGWLPCWPWQQHGCPGKLSRWVGCHLPAVDFQVV